MPKRISTNWWTVTTATWCSSGRNASTNGERGLLPVAVIEKDISNRMASTIRHNRARGTHNVELMSEIVAELTRAQMSDQWIMRHIGMDRDELLRLKQITGLAELFADKEFSPGDTEDEAVEPARIMR